MKIIKISTPLPDVNEEYPKNEPTINKIDKMFTEENVEKFEEIYPNAKKIKGHGFFGIAYDTGSSIVKLTTDKTEKKMADKIINENMYQNIFPNIYNVHTFQTNSNEIYAIEMEKIQTLNEIEKRIFNEIQFKMKKILGNMPTVAPVENIKNIKNDIINIINKKNIMTDLKNKMKMMLNKYIELHEKVKEQDLLRIDLHENNLGWKNNELIVLDIGQMI